MSRLAGRTILVTRSREQSGDLAEALRNLGARVIEAPVIAFEDPEDWAPVDEAVGGLQRYQWILFTSVNAVERFLDRLEGLLPGGVRSWPRAARIAAIGPATAEALAARGLDVSRTASSSRAEGMAALLSAEGLSGTRILLPRAAVAREVLPDRLREAGAVVEVVTVYRTIPLDPGGEVRALLAASAIDMVTFTSASTVSNLIAAVGGPQGLGGALVGVIGPVTADAVRDHGIAPAVVAARASVRDLAEAIGRYFDQD